MAAFLLPARQLTRTLSTTSTLSRAQFNWEDGLDLSSLLSGEETQLRDSVRSFAQDYLQPRILEESRSESSGDPSEIFHEFGRLGILGCTLKGYGM